MALEMHSHRQAKLAPKSEYKNSQQEQYHKHSVTVMLYIPHTATHEDKRIENILVFIKRMANIT